MSASSASARPKVKLQTVVMSAVMLWATYFLLATLRWEVMDVGFRWEMIRLRTVVTIAGIAMTLLLWVFLRRFDTKALWTQALAALLLSLPVAVGLSFINDRVFSEMNALMEERYMEEMGVTANPIKDIDIGKEGPNSGIRIEHEERIEEDSSIMRFFSPLTEVAFGRYFMMLAWCSIYFALVAVSKARIAERREQEFRNAAKAAELRSLRYQVNPHFLFNTLNSLSALVMTGKQARAEQMIQTISNFYRHSLAAEPTADVPLVQEFDLQRHYLTIESVRFPDRLRTKFDLPQELRDARVPGMILQPLVENSVKYAVSTVNRPVTITIAATEEFDRLVLCVSDDGPGVPDGTEHGFGIGLANVRDRLEARFGSEVSMVSGPTEAGYRTEIRIPLTRNG